VLLYTPLVRSCCFAPLAQHGALLVLDLLFYSFRLIYCSAPFARPIAQVLFFVMLVILLLLTPFASRYYFAPLVLDWCLPLLCKCGRVVQI